MCRMEHTHHDDQWQVHRVLRPEAYGGLVHNTLTAGRPNTPLDSSILENTVSWLDGQLGYEVNIVATNM